MTDIEKRRAELEFAVVIAALLAGRCDGQEAVASLTAIHERKVAAAIAEAKAEALREAAAEVPHEYVRVVMDAEPDDWHEIPIEDWLRERADWLKGQPDDRR